MSNEFLSNLEFMFEKANRASKPLGAGAESCGCLVHLYGMH